MKKAKVKRTIRIALSLVLLVALAAGGLFWNKYLNKNSLLGKYETPKAQDVYILGTLHKNHFNRWLNYSMADILSVVETVQPDVVFIEAREAYFKDYGVIDGPIDMAVVYSYCIDQDIPVELIDWWVVDNSFKSNTTSDKRDDQIVGNIADKLETIKADTTILVVCGSGHFYEQAERFQNNGFKKQKIKNKAAYFDNQNKAFEYPTSVEKIWEQRAYFYAYTFPEIIEQDQSLDDEVKAEFTEGDHDAYYEQQLNYNTLFSNNALYKS